MQTQFCDWDPLSRRSSALLVAAERCRMPLTQPGGVSQEEREAVFVDVTDNLGQHRTIELRRDDDPVRLVEEYSKAVGGITTKQRSKLLAILHQTIEEHFHP